MTTRLYTRGLLRAFSPQSYFPAPRFKSSSSSKSVSFKDTETKDIELKDNIDVSKMKVYNRTEWWTVPNAITLTRMASSPFLGYAIVLDYKEVALVGCCVAGFSDWLDGYIAKSYNQATLLGGLLDPIADKFLIGSLTAGMALKGLLPMELAYTILGRDLVLLAATFGFRLLEQPEGTPFFDTTYSATFEIIPSELSKANTVVQFTLLITTLSQFSMDIPSLQGVIESLWWITGTTTLGSFVGYLDGSAVKRLSNTGETRRIKGQDM